MVGGTPSSHGRGVPHPVIVGGYPGTPHHLDLAWVPCHHPDLAGVPPPPSRPGWGTPPHHPDLARVPPHHPDLARVPPIKTWLGYTPPHHPDLAGVSPHHPHLAGVPPPTIQTWPGYPTPLEVWTDKLKTIPSPILRMRVVISGTWRHENLKFWDLQAILQ